MFRAEKGIVGDFLTVCIWGMVMIFMIVFVVVFKQLSDNNHFSAYASTIVSRHGGMTQDAKDAIEAYSESSYGGRYKVLSEVEGPHAYGTPVTFLLVSQTKVLYFEIPIRIQFGGHAVSRIRR